MCLQYKKLAVSLIAATGLVIAAAVQAQTSTQNPPPAKPKAQTAAPAAAPAPQGQPPSAGQLPPPPPGGMGQGQGMGQGMGPGMRQGRPMPGMMGNPRARGRLVQRGMAQLNLTQAQKDQMKALREQQQKDTQAVRERMKTARQTLQETMKADIPEEAAVKTAAGALATVQAEQFALQARGKAQMTKLLTPEQQKHMKDFRDRANLVGQRQMQRGNMMQRGGMMPRGDMMGRGMRRNQMAPGWGPMMGPMWREQLMRQEMARRWRGWI
jgi:Spy/CpxP family protein refolding chaperone